MASPTPDSSAKLVTTGTYVRVLVIEAVILVALYSVSAYFR